MPKPMQSVCFLSMMPKLKTEGARYVKGKPKGVSISMALESMPQLSNVIDKRGLFVYL